MERRSASGVDLDTPMTSGPRERVTAQDWFREDHPLDERHSAIDEVPRRDYAQSSATRFERRTPLHNGSSGNHNLAHRSPPSPDFQVSRDHGYRDPQHHRRLSHPAVSQKPHLAEWDIPSKPTHRNRSWHKPSFGDRNYHPDDRSAFNGRPSAPSGRSSVPPSGSISIPPRPSVSTASVDPRRSSRQDAAVSAGPSPRQGAQSLQESSGFRPGSQTPKTPTYPSAFEDHRIKELTTVLNEFTSHVTSMASLTMQRDSAKKEFERREQDYDKSRRHHAAYAPLAEQQENSKAKAQRRFEQLEEQLNKHVAAREKLSSTIASKIISHSNAQDTATLGRLDAEVQTMSKHLRDAKADSGQIRYWGPKLLEVKEASKLAQQAVTDVKESLAPLRALGSRTEKLESRINDFPNLRMELSKIRDEVKSFGKVIDKAVTDLDEVRELVEEKDHKLTQSIQRLDNVIAEHTTALQKVDEDLENFDSELDRLTIRVKAVEGSAVTGGHRNASGTVNDSSARVQIAKLETDMEAFRTEQQARDDMVADEIEQVLTKANKLESDYTNMRESLDDLRTRFDTLKTDLDHPSATDTGQKPSSAGNVSNHIAGFADTSNIINGTQRELETEQIQKLHDEVRQQQDIMLQLRNQMDGMRFSIEYLDERFSKLTTEHLARNMVGLLSKMYPQGASILTSVDQVRNNYEALQHKLQGFSVSLDEFRKEQQQREQQASMVTTTTPHPPTPQEPEIPRNANKDASEVYTKAETDQLVADLRKYVLDMIDLSNVTATQMQELKSKVNSIWDATAREFGALSVQVENLKEQRRNSGGGGGGGASINETTEIRPSPVMMSSRNNTSAQRQASESGSRPRKRRRKVVSSEESDWQGDEQASDDDEDDDDDEFDVLAPNATAATTASRGAFTGRRAGGLRAGRGRAIIDSQQEEWSSG